MIRTFIAAALVAAGASSSAANDVLSGRAVEELRQDTDRLLNAALDSDHAWSRLVELCEGIGHRLSGSEGLEQAVSWATDRMTRDGLENVRQQPVLVPHWIRGEESAEMTAPFQRPLRMLGIGHSVGTPPGGISGEVIVVSNFEEFEQLPTAAVQGRMVLWDCQFKSYGRTVRYRREGARLASLKGATASLIRSVATGNPHLAHTGSLTVWESGERAIPAAALSIEDAMMIARLAANGQSVHVHLEMDAREAPDALSHNVIGEIVGREFPDEVVVIGAHLDSWDVGQGAQDDGGGCIVAMEAMRLMRQLELRPRRTVRVVLWTNEEDGELGAAKYFESVHDEIGNHVAAIECDGGVEAPWGFGVSVWKNAARDTNEPEQERVLEFIQRLGALLSSIQAGSVRAGGGGADIAPLMECGVPGLALRTPMASYWDVHHTHSDTIDAVNPASLQRNVAAMAVMAYALAEIPIRLHEEF